MKKYAGFDNIPADERAAFIRAAAAAQTKEELEAIEQLIKARCRKASKAASDKRQRILIGVRLPRQQADLIKAAAAKEGKSLYKFTKKVLLTAAQMPDTIPENTDIDDQTKEQAFEQQNNHFVDRTQSNKPTFGQNNPNL